MADQTPSSSPRRLPRVALVIPVLLLVAAATVAIGRLTGAPSFHGTAYEPPEPAPAFSLTDQNGRPARLADFRGKTVFLYFGYTSCPDVCPITLKKLQHTLEALGAGPDEARVLFITVDPATDTPARLASYLEHYGPGFTGLTADAARLAPIYKAYGVYAAPVSGKQMHHDGPMVNHSDVVFGIDREGRLRVLLHADAPEARFTADAETLLGL